MIYLRLEEDGPVTTFALQPGVASTLGREAGNDIVIRRLQVSRQHVRVRPASGGVHVEDLGSRNGSHVQRVARSGRKPSGRWLPVPLADDASPDPLMLNVGDKLRLGGPGGPVLVVAEAVPMSGAPRDAPRTQPPIARDPMASVSTLDATQEEGAAQLELLRSLAAQSWTVPTADARHATLERLRLLTQAERVDLLTFETRPVASRDSTSSLPFEHAASLMAAFPGERGGPAGASWVPLETGRIALVLPAAGSWAACFEYVDRPRLSAEYICRLDAIVQIAFPWMGLGVVAEGSRVAAPEISARAQAWERPGLLGGGGPPLIAASAAMRRVCDEATDAATSGLPVLLTGETGVGKEVVARFIHAQGTRRGRCFVSFDCGAITAERFEAEMFGGGRPVADDADGDASGSFEDADGGSLFLDEVANLTAPQQARLLRVFQTGELRRVGERRIRHSDVRLISATNVDLEASVAAGRFRPDLYHRIAAIRIAIPPLRGRRDDVLPLADAALGKLAAGGRTNARSFDMEVRTWLRAQDWPGNVRELESCVAAAASRCRGDVVTMADVSPSRDDEHEQPLADLLQLPLEPAQAEFRRRYLRHVLDASAGNKSRAARHAGVDVRTIREMARRLDEAEPAADDDA